MFSDLIKSKKSPSQARIDQLLKELFSADSERDEDEDGDEMDKGGALDYLKRHRGESARAALKSYSTEDGDELEKAEGEDSDEDGDELEKKAQRASEEMSELFDEDEDKGEDSDEDESKADEDKGEDSDEDEDMKKGDMSKEDKAQRRDLMSRAYSIIDDLSDEQLSDFLSASEIKKALIMGVIDRLSTPELKEFCSPEQANGATGSEPMSEG